MTSEPEKRWQAFQEEILDKALTDSENLLRKPVNLANQDQGDKWVFTRQSEKLYPYHDHRRLIKKMPTVSKPEHGTTKLCCCP